MLLHRLAQRGQGVPRPAQRARGFRSDPVHGREAAVGGAPQAVHGHPLALREGAAHPRQSLGVGQRVVGLERFADQFFVEGAQGVRFEMGQGLPRRFQAVVHVAEGGQSQPVGVVAQDAVVETRPVVGDEQRRVGGARVGKVHEGGERPPRGDEGVAVEEPVVLRQPRLEGQAPGAPRRLVDHALLPEQTVPEPERALRVLARALERLRQRKPREARVDEALEGVFAVHGADLHDEVAAPVRPRGAGARPRHDAGLQVVEHDPRRGGQGRRPASGQRRHGCVHRHSRGFVYMPAPGAPVVCGVICPRISPAIFCRRSRSAPPTTPRSGSAGTRPRSCVWWARMCGWSTTPP